MKHNNLVSRIFARDFFRDRYSVILFTVMTILMLINVGLVIIFSDPTSQQVIKTSYLGYGSGTFTIGNGYDNYMFLVFAVVSYVIWATLSIKTFSVRKSLSMLQQYLGIIVLVMLFFVSRALIFA